MLDVHPDAAAIFKDIPCDAFTRRSHDHGEPPFLAVAPDVRGFAAQGSFVQISISHQAIISGNYILQVLLPYAKM
jgi:hypothetical protein